MKNVSHTLQRINRIASRHPELALHLFRQYAIRVGKAPTALPPAEALRELERAHNTIHRLSEIGREITSSLDRDTIMNIVYRHVHELIGAEVFAVGLYRPEKSLIEFPCNLLRGRRMLPYVRDANDTDLLSVWCIQHQKEVFINDIHREYARYIGPDGLRKLTVFEAYPEGMHEVLPTSHIYVPMVLKGKTTGLIAIQCMHANAFQEMHLDMAKTLAAYTAIAIDNADTYQQLAQAQQILVSQERLAALGALVAGVAHELNTPIGNSLLTASTLQEETQELTKIFNANQLRRSGLENFLDMLADAQELLLRNLMNASELVSSFKQVSADQASQQRRSFNLLQTSTEILRTVQNQIQKQGHHIVLDIPPQITLDSYPGPYGQIITNLIHNALLHAFEGRSSGQMRLQACQSGAGEVTILFADDGCGIPGDHLRRIFDPFFTTKLGQGGSGLGLSIVHNLVTSIMQGSITVQSTPGHGTSFTLVLPLHLPQEI
ncbi:ATP-binding protein [Undibacterium oligocarboniphilum]|uniref:histidine kinase n=1 Tax=Undibacterium oligocarboniphilum TaxID=666702 RepID=A0A850QER7_9BURK|nr:GAF domain-containing sensor histidine kinase [Undibacterium oligocarboniphilum]MBC3869429.1 GAF domain-containing sensor histidine kinase [Undibacterium oligocarboniphilum]NVO77808.1 GAF domain-containing sensor histidine kinase [Undibacterium oligocarboniphilum]